MTGGFCELVISTHTLNNLWISLSFMALHGPTLLWFEALVVAWGKNVEMGTKCATWSVNLLLPYTNYSSEPRDTCSKLATIWGPAGRLLLTSQSIWRGT